MLKRPRYCTAIADAINNLHGQCKPFNFQLASAAQRGSCHFTWGLGRPRVKAFPSKFIRLRPFQRLRVKPQLAPAGLDENASVRVVQPALLPQPPLAQNFQSRLDSNGYTSVDFCWSPGAGAVGKLCNASPARIWCGLMLLAAKQAPVETRQNKIAPLAAKGLGRLETTLLMASGLPNPSQVSCWLTMHLSLAVGSKK